MTEYHSMITKKVRQDIIKMLDDYPEWIDNHRNEVRRIYRQDETWLFKNMACNKGWKTDNCFTVPTGKGEPYILSHIECADLCLLD